MKAYTFQIGDGNGDTMPKPAYSETLHADSLGEAIDKAKAITNLRPPHAKETTVRIVEGEGDDAYPMWASTIEAVRKG